MDEKKYNIIFFGTPEFSVSSLDALLNIPSITVSAVFTQPDKKVGRRQKALSSQVKNYALTHDIPIYQPENIKGNSFQSFFSSLKPDAVVLVAYGKIIPETLLTIPAFGWLNVHASLLPLLRGASPIQHAILQGMDTTGVTLMKIVKKLDAGPVFAQKSVNIQPRENFQSLHDTLSQLGGKILQQSLIPYLAGSLTPQNQNEVNATFCKQLSKKDGQIDWSKSAIEIDRFIRAMTPWPGAYTSLKGSNLIILSSHCIEKNTSKDYGILSTTDDELVVSTTQGSLVVDTLQQEGKKKLSASQFINGYGKILPVQLS
ncbi:methionyl-tRNA formyltransferase [Patescibacteria group bacterium]